MKPTKNEGGRVVTIVPMDYEPTPPPPLKLRRHQHVPLSGYDAIKSVDYYSGTTVWEDGKTTKWAKPKRRATFDPQARPSSPQVKQAARFRAYWSTHPYECQVCGINRDAAGYLQVPINPHEGKIRLYLATGDFNPGEEPDDELLALCDSCCRETSELADQPGAPAWGLLVLRLQGKRKRQLRQRSDLIAEQRRERENLRARKQEWRAEIDRRKEAGEILDAEFRSEYADVYTFKSA